jgi:hypothetical protein
MGEKLPLWIPPNQNDQSKAAADAAEKSSTMVSIGMSNLGYGITFSPFPEKVITTATGFSYFHENSTSSLSMKNAVAGDSLSLIDSITGRAPFAVTEKNSLDHIRAGWGLRFNTWPVLKTLDFLPFPVNPFVGAGALLDVSFGTTAVRPVDSLGFADTRFDSSYAGFDSTYNRFFLDVGLAFPIGVEIFPFKKTDVPFIKDMGISFVYTIYALYRTVALPAKDLNPYNDFINNNSNNSNNNSNNNNSGNNNSNNNNSDSTSSNNSGSNGNKNNNLPLWTGWARISSTSEYRVSLEFMF